MALISASRRTDIPAFYGPWLMDRLKAGRVPVRNPFRADQVREVDLSPGAVDGFIFWTRWPKPFGPHLAELERRDRPSYFQMTLTGMGPPLEAHLPPEHDLIRAFAHLSGMIGRDRLVWRFDPLLVTRLTPPEEILARFNRLAGNLTGLCRKQVIISLARLYRKTGRRLARLENLQVQDLEAEGNLAQDLVSRLSRVARGHGLELAACAAETDFSNMGVGPAKCVDETILNQNYGLHLSGKPDRGQRGTCNCSASIDIGSYNSCTHGCRYCYATASQPSAAANRARHRTPGPELIPARTGER